MNAVACIVIGAGSGVVLGIFLMAAIIQFKGFDE